MSTSRSSLNKRGAVNDVISKSSGRSTLVVGTAVWAGAVAVPPPNGCVKPKKIYILLFLEEKVLLYVRDKPPPIVNAGAVVAGAVGNPNPVKGVGATVVVDAPNGNVDGAVLVVAPNPVKTGLTAVVPAVAVDVGLPKLNTDDAVVAAVGKLNDVAGFETGAPNKGPVDAVVLVVGAPNVNGFPVGAVVVVVLAGVPKRVGLVVEVAPNENAI